MHSLRVIESIGDFRGISDAWAGLLAESPANTIFLSHSYLCSWWDHFHRDQRLFVILAEESGGRLDAAAPLCIRECRILGRGIRVAEILGSGPVPTRPMGLSDRTGLIARAPLPACGQFLPRWLQAFGKEWDVLHLKGIGTETETPPEDFPAHDSKEWRVESASRYRSPYLKLEGSFDGYCRTRSKTFRKQLKKHRRELEAIGPVSVEKGEATMSGPDLLRAVHDIALKSWKSAWGSELFQNRDLRLFFEDLFEAFRREGRLRARFLVCGGRRIAHEICFLYNRKLYSYNSCFDKGYARFSPGEQLTAEILDEAFGEGLAEYDMLRGDEPYKLRWSPACRTEQEMLIGPDRFDARLYSLVQLRLKGLVRNNPFLSGLDTRLSGLFHNLFTHRKS